MFWRYAQKSLKSSIKACFSHLLVSLKQQVGYTKWQTVLRDVCLCNIRSPNIMSIHLMVVLSLFLLSVLFHRWDCLAFVRSWLRWTALYGLCLMSSGPLIGHSNGCLLICLPPREVLSNWFRWMDATKASWGGTKVCEITAWELY